jgi:hypothetical protein
MEGGDILNNVENDGNEEIELCRKPRTVAMSEIERHLKIIESHAQRIPFLCLVRLPGEVGMRIMCCMNPDVCVPSFQMALIGATMDGGRLNGDWIKDFKHVMTHEGSHNAIISEALMDSAPEAFVEASVSIESIIKAQMKNETNPETMLEEVSFFLVYRTSVRLHVLAEYRELDYYQYAIIPFLKAVFENATLTHPFVHIGSADDLFGYDALEKELTLFCKAPLAQPEKEPVQEQIQVSRKKLSKRKRPALSPASVEILPINLEEEEENDEIVESSD